MTHTQPQSGTGSRTRGGSQDRTESRPRSGSPLQGASGAQSETWSGPPGTSTADRAGEHPGRDGATPVLSVSDLRVSYTSRGTRTRVVHGVSLEIGPGEVVAVVGESGSGKTTTAQAVVGLLPENGRVTGGSVVLNGVDITGWSDRRLESVRGSRVGLVPQDPNNSLNPVKRVGDGLAEVLRIHRWADRRRIRARVLELLERVGIPDPALRARQYPHELSGGMRQRVLIASAVALRPELVIADEATSALDVTVQKTILDLLDELRSEDGTAVLLVTHDLAVAADRADRVVVLKDGRVQESGPTGTVLTRPASDYTRQLLNDAPSLAGAGRGTPDPARVREARTSANGAGEVAADTDRSRSCRAHADRVREDRASALQASGIQVPANEVPANEVPAIEVRDLVQEFGPRRRRFRAVDEVSFTVASGTTHAIVGESGSGKTTTARAVMGFRRPTSGTVAVSGQDVGALRGRDLRNLRGRLQMVYQNPFGSLDPRQSVEAIVTEPLLNYGIGDRSERAATVAEFLDRVALPATALRRRPRELSGGQRQRVAIARALVLRPEVVVLDEPVSALDVTVQAQILDLLEELQDELGLTYLFISHDLAVVRRLSHTLTVMSEGRVMESGPTGEVFASPGHDYTRSLIEAIPGKRATAAARPAARRQPSAQ
ncbi:dipeptide ABC transporter ATP-binding protein [Nocardiopsis eucommiae]|uniref:dipeptide ABC transporter ATP-binding protein n=1 Tax=Nocardiopsis eucommiae TaxID=2831970 RepID=UPI003D73813C